MENQIVIEPGIIIEPIVILLYFVFTGIVALAAYILGHSKSYDKGYQQGVNDTLENKTLEDQIIHAIGGSLSKAMKDVEGKLGRDINEKG